MKKFRWIIIAALYLVANGIVTAEDKSSADAAPLMQCIVDTAARESFHGVVIAGRLGALPEAAAFNNDDIPGQPPALSTRMNIGSMSKMFTAVAISQLVDQGVLSFGESVRTYIPGLPTEYEDITLHHLLTHTGGTGNYFRPGNMAVMRQARSASDLLPLITATPLQNPPGEKFSYSNSGFALLGVVIEQVTGSSYASYISENIFKPASMHSTGLEPDDNTAVGFTRFSRNRPPGTTPSSTAPLRQSSMTGVRGMAAGGGYSTVGDLYRFAVALYEDRLTKPDTTKRILSPKPGTDLTTRDGDSARYGYGFYISEDGDRVGHGGGGPGINGELRVRHKSGWVIAALTNIDPPAASNLVAALEKRLLSKCDAPDA